MMYRRRSTNQLFLLSTQHSALSTSFIVSSPEGETFPHHATGNRRKGTTGRLRERLPEGNNGKNRERSLDPPLRPLDRPLPARVQRIALPSAHFRLKRSLNPPLTRNFVLRMPEIGRQP